MTSKPDTLSPSLSFDQFLYKRPDMKAIETTFDGLIGEFRSATNISEQNRVIAAINRVRTDYATAYNICYIRHTIDTTDAFYEKENDFFDETNPTFDSLVHKYYRALLDSRFRDQLKDQWGAQLFAIAELSLKTFDDEVLADIQEENRLSSEYVKLKASAKLMVDGEEYNLSGITALTTSEDRTIRKKANETKWAFYEKHQAEFDRIFDEQVKVRTRIARALGYDNFVGLAYDRLLRSDYGAEQVAVFRQQVKDHIVPIASRLYERQRQRIGLDRLTYYDVGFKFASGNPKPKGDPDWIVAQAADMYRELSDETHQFFHFMQDRKLMDVVNRKGKATGGYCTFVPDYKSPFIFSNFNGTTGDITVLTHEAGHAFQVYASRNMELKEYNWPTYEACEIHSMSMEFFTWPWMKLFFKEDTDKFKFSHLAGALLFLPYGVAVDEFQHLVYEQPDLSPAERDAAWRKIEQKYLPHMDYDGHTYLENGGFWKQQSHIFSVPFYYIDYTLAQICAFQFWQRDTADHEAAWNDYLRLCEAGGSQSFLKLVELAGLRSPFEKGCVESVVDNITSWLDGIDDGNF